MFTRFVAASALALVFATPAFAACEDEIGSLDQAMVAAETGAATDSTGGMPATKHQQQVTGQEATGEQAAKDQDAAGEKPSSGEVTGSVEAASPHQKQVLKEIPDDDRTTASTLLTEARDMAKAGDEQGCMDKVTEAKKLLGMEE